MPGKMEGRRRRGQQRMRWLDSIIDSMDMSLSRLQVTGEEREACGAAVHEDTKNQTWLSNWTTTKTNLFFETSNFPYKKHFRTSALCFLYSFHVCVLIQKPTEDRLKVRAQFPTALVSTSRLNPGTALVSPVVKIALPAQEPGFSLWSGN